MQKISIVIPVYNAEAYLVPCLESCLAQDYGEFDIICVNDGSTDGSIGILQQYAGRNVRIQVVEQENTGVVAARRNGVNTSSAEYIFFLDSDDLILPGALQLLAEYTNRADMITGAWVTYSGTLNGFRREVEDTIITEGLDSLRRHLLQGASFMMGRLIRRALFAKESISTHLKFDEDHAMLSQLFHASKRSVFIDAPVFAYRPHAASVTKSCNFETFLTWRDSMMSVEKYLQDQGILEHVKSAWRCRKLYWEFTGLLNGINRFGYTKSRLFGHVWKYLVLSPKDGVYCLRNFKGSMKFFIPLCLFSPVISARLCLYYSRLRSRRR